MPDTTASTTAVWFLPVVTVLIGYVTKSLSEWLENRRTREREIEAREAARRDKLFEQRIGFQRQTLLDLQEALMQLVRTVGAMHHQDQMAYRQTGKWQKQPFREDLNEANRLAQARTSMLAVRVRDESVRELVQKLKAHCINVVMSGTQVEGEIEMMSAGGVHEEANQRMGELLRKLDDEAGV